MYAALQVGELAVSYGGIDVLKRNSGFRGGVNRLFTVDVLRSMENAWQLRYWPSLRAHLYVIQFKWIQWVS